MKVVTVVGTRPEIIKLAPTVKRISAHMEHVLVHTGQNYDYELNQIFFEDLEIKKPDFFLDVRSSSLGAQIGAILSRGEEVLLKERPDALLILGDTNSALIAIIAKRLKIPIFHMEAGNRCFDDNVPEEINRRIIDHISDVNIVFSEHARRNLLREGLHPQFIFLCGSPMAEVHDMYKEKINASTILQQLNLREKEYYVVSIHREEVVDVPARLQTLIETLKIIVEKFHLPIIVTTHPRTEKNLKKFNIEIDNSRILFHKAFAFTDYIHLQKKAFCVISDSGTIFEESSMLGFPAIVPRESTERPEALDTGACIQTGLDRETILNAIQMVVSEKVRNVAERIPDVYRQINISSRVARLILGMTRIIHKKVWGDIKK